MKKYILSILSCIVILSAIMIIHNQSDIIEDQERVLIDRVLEIDSLKDSIAEAEESLANANKHREKIAEDLAHLEYIIDTEEDIMEYAGEFSLTAYCSCEICCEQYASNRPVVKGREIIFTASKSIAEQGITIAVDPKVIPYGTKVYIEGIGVRVAQDCGGAIKGNRIDVYYDNHTDALKSGLGHTMRSIWIINEG